MECPHCRSELALRRIRGVGVHECKECKGMWFEDRELKQVKDEIDADLNWMDFDIWKHSDRFKAGKPVYDCPGCSRSMVILNYDNTGVEIHYCSTCRGVWLEKGELKKIITALEDEILTKSMDEYLHTTLEKARELITGKESFLSEWKDLSTILRFVQYRILSLHPKIRNAMVTFQINPLNR